jgi:hypothetical protein
MGDRSADEAVCGSFGVNELSLIAFPLEVFGASGGGVSGAVGGGGLADLVSDGAGLLPSPGPDGGEGGGGIDDAGLPVSGAGGGGALVWGGGLLAGVLGSEGGDDPIAMSPSCSSFFVGP